MSHLEQIQRRHSHDLWQDAIFIGAALVIAVAIGAPALSHYAPRRPAWTLTVIESQPELQLPHP